MKFKRLSLKNKNNMRLLFYILLFMFISVFPVHAATYNYYFSNAGSGSTCSEVAPCANLSDAQTKIDNANSGDTVNLYFNKGDTWTMDTDAVSPTIVYGLDIGSDDPIVNIDAYGSGAKPKFYGTISQGGTWFDTVPESDTTNGPLRWNTIFRFQRNNCSVKNIHIDGVYAHGISLGRDAGDPVDYFTLEGCDITNFGNIGIGTSYKWATQNTTVTKNTIHTGQQLQKYDKWGDVGNFWGAAILLNPAGWKRSPANNTVSYNVVYDIAGEGIHCFGATIEYNVVGDTGSVGIYIAPWNQDAADTIVRYNLVVMSDLSSSEYDNDPDIGHDGIGVADERSGGNNSNANVEVYGNIVINRFKGIFFASYHGSISPWASVKIYNNTIIDSKSTNLAIAEPAHDMVAAGKGFIKNNLSILYDRTSSSHAQDWSDPADLSTYFTIDNNYYWTSGGSPTVDVDWRTNYITTDPKLHGEEKDYPVDWDGQTGATYFSDITLEDVTPESDSDLINGGDDLGWEATFLAPGSDFALLPTSVTFVTKQQSHDGKWDIGAIIYSESKAILKPPVDLKVNIAEP